MMTNDKITNLVNLLNYYKGYSYKSSINDRLNKTLDLYKDDLDRTCKNIMTRKRKDVVMKELSK